MLTRVPAESNAFGTIAGLPLHPLVVHAAVVFLPLAVLGIMALVLVPRWRERYWLLTGAATVIGGIAAFGAKESGEALERAHGGVGFDHAEWGDRLFMTAGIFTVLSLIWLVLQRISKNSRGLAITGLGALAALAGIVVLGVTAMTGHSGAKAAWADDPIVSGATADATAAANPTASASATASGSASAGESNPAKATAAEITLATVKQHNGASSCYAAISGNVYDLTKWINQHPGGANRILNICGTDATQAFTAQHGGESRPAQELAQFKIGALAKS